IRVFYQRIRELRRIIPMNLKSSLVHLRRRTLLLIAVIALSAAMLPTAAFASSYGHQGRAWDPGPRQQRGYHRPAQNKQHNRYDKHYNQDKQYNHNAHKDHGKQYKSCDVTYKVKRG